MFAVASTGRLRPIETRKVATLALALGADVELFHCIFDKKVARPGRFGSRGAQEDIHGFIEQRHCQLERAAQSLRLRGVRVTTSVRWDYPFHEGIVRQVLRHRPSLLIVQSTPKQGVARALLSRTDYRLIETCPCSVLLMKTRRTYWDATLVAAVDPEQSHGKPDSLDDRILDAATRLRDALSAKLQVLHVQTPWENVIRRNPELGNVPDVEKNDIYSAYCNSIENELRSLTRRHDVPDQQVLMVEGHPAEVLPRFASREKVDMVVIGAVARSWLKRLLVGHTAERVLDYLDCDVLVVKPEGFRSTVSSQSAHHVARSAARRARFVW
jgi:universal stress protein E